jgi:uncharacterized protein (DUF433 family)
MNTTNDLFDYIDIDPEVRGGQPVLKGRRIPVSTILAEIAEGNRTISQIEDDWYLENGEITAVLKALAIYYDDRSNFKEMHTKSIALVKCENCGTEVHGKESNGYVNIEKMAGWNFEEDTWLCPKCLYEAAQEAEVARH